MTPEAAVYSWMNGFNIPAYTSDSVPDQDGPMWQGFPYIEYTLPVGAWMRGEVNMNANLYDRTESIAQVNAKAREIGDALGIGGVTLPCDGGMLWLKKGDPFVQPMNVEGEDEMVKRRYININIEFLVTE